MKGSTLEKSIYLFDQKKFVLIDNLKENEKIHTEEKPFSCSFCENKLVLKDDLKEHERIHTGRKPFSCPGCGKKFVKKDDLRENERIHTIKSHSAVQVVARNLLRRPERA